MIVDQGAEDSHELYYRIAKPDNGKLDFNGHGLINANTTGWGPKVVVTDKGTVIEIHESSTIEEQRIWYRIGHLLEDKSSVEWRTWYTEFNNGHDPSAGALSDSVIIETHCYDGWIWYNIGIVDLNTHTVKWHKDASPLPGAKGFVPTVTVVGQKVVIMWAELSATFEGPLMGDDSKIWYRTGTYNAANNSIDWDSGQKEFGAVGGSPQLTTINGDTIMAIYGHELELHPADPEEEFPRMLQTIYYRTGKLNKDGSINWYQDPDHHDRYKVLSNDTDGNLGTIMSFTTFTTNDSVYVLIAAGNTSYDGGSYYVSANIKP